jgi:low affinity Fe/Cu permease
VEKTTGRRRISRFLHLIGEATSRASTAGLVTLAVVGFLVLLAVNGFPIRWEDAFSVAASAITLVMVFVIQHTQSRQQVATQLKLDELIRAVPRADDLLIHVEAADDDELIAMVKEGIEEHSAIREASSEDVPLEGRPEPDPGSSSA